MINLIEAFLRDHVKMCRDVMAQGDDALSDHEALSRLAGGVRHYKALVDRYGEDRFAQIHDRARALVRQLFGGEDAPPLANYQLDGLALVEADLISETILAECRRFGVRPSKDPGWRATLNARCAALWDQYEARRPKMQTRGLAPAPSPNLDAWRAYIGALLEFSIAAQSRWQSPVAADEVARLGAIAFPGPGDEQLRRAVEYIARYAAAQALELSIVLGPLEVDAILTSETATAMRQFASEIATAIVKRQTKAPAPNPEPPNLEAMVAAAVDARLQGRNGPAGDARSAQFRRGIAVTEYCGVWEPGAVYGAGTMVTDRGQLWFAEAESVTGRPGNTPGWKLMHKSLEKAGR